MGSRNTFTLRSDVTITTLDELVKLLGKNHLVTLFPPQPLLGNRRDSLVGASIRINPHQVAILYGEKMTEEELQEGLSTLDDIDKVLGVEDEP